MIKVPKYVGYRCIEINSILEDMYTYGNFSLIPRYLDKKLDCFFFMCKKIHRILSVSLTRFKKLLNLSLTFDSEQ